MEHVRPYIEKFYPEYYGWFEYPADKTAAFCNSDGPWGILGNFGKTPLVVGGVSFDCAEKLFQVMKFSATESRRLVYSVSGLHIKMTAKRRDLSPTIRDDWGMIIVDALKFCLMQKYEQSAAFRLELERSRGLSIVEVQSNPRKPADTYSTKLSTDGTTWSGPNLMGRLLMELRDNGTLEYHLPDDVMDFSDLK